MRLLVIALLANLWMVASAQVNCDIVLDNGPEKRQIGTDEENIENSLGTSYKSIGQRFNGIKGDIASITFWARTNPGS